MDGTARASGPSVMPHASGSSVTKATLALIPALARPRPPPSAIRRAMIANVCASAETRRANTRRPSSRCSGPSDNADASS